jgi:hypothetical protein
VAVLAPWCVSALGVSIPQSGECCKEFAACMAVSITWNRWQMLGPHLQGWRLRAGLSVLQDPAD